MVYGYYNKVTKVYHKHTRIGSSVKMTDASKIDIDDHVWIGHFCLLDGIGNIKIGRGVNIASHSAIYSHSSQNAIRFLGDKFIEVPASQRPGYVIEKVAVGDYTFIGTGCILLPGTELGKGCVVGAGSVVKVHFRIILFLLGIQAKVIGDTRVVDQDLVVRTANQ
ncbi:MAG: acyltransferase [Bacteroidetes bacterium]|nr:acyltransferase [Bacteroidota bacterium]